MAEQPLFVDSAPFLGRIEEQKQFIATLQDVLNQPATETLPYIILLYGDGGMGKTTLARRYRDIANDRPFRGKFQTLWIDWEDERKRYASLQVGRENIGPEAVFDVMHAAVVRARLADNFTAYQKIKKLRDEAEKKAAEVVSAADERSELAALRGASAEALAKLVRTQVPIGSSGEKLVTTFLDAGIKIGAEQAAKVRGQLETRLRAKLKPEQFNVFLNPPEQLALALADGLKKIAADQPLLFFLDTYEIADRADIWLRVVIRAAGPRVLWIIGGRNDLVKNRLYGADYFKGYPDDFPRRLLPYDMRQLAIDDICRYFGACAPDRPVSDEDIEAISRATRGIPLAIRQAADIWRRGAPLSDLIGDTTDHTPRAEIVQKMTERYLLHVIAEADKQAIYALALARGDVDLLRAMLRPEGAAVFDLETLLHRLERDYASVHAEHARLHDEPADFFQAYLRAEVRHTEDRVRLLNQRAVTALRERLKKLEADLPLIEDRHANEDWVKAALDLTYYLFWLDENEAWHWFIPRFVESLAYSRELRRGLSRIANGWNNQLSATGKHRLKVLQSQDALPGLRSSTEDEADRLAALEDLAARGWLKGDGDTERYAILDLRRGKWLYGRKKYAEALACYDRTEQSLPENGTNLKEQLGEALSDLTEGFMWPEGQTSALYSAEAERILPKVVSWLPEKQGAWYRLGATLNLAGKNEESIAAYQRAIELDPKLAAPHNGLGNVYADLGRTTEAIAAFQRALELDPKDAYPHNGLGNVYQTLGRTSEAIAAYQRALELDPKLAAPHNGLGNVYQTLGRTEEAIAAYQRALELDPKHGVARASLVGCLRKLGRATEAAEHEKIARELIGQESEYNRACFEAICGNTDGALSLLKTALDKNQTSLAWARRDPDLESLRADPRFIALVGTAADDLSSTDNPSG